MGWNSFFDIIISIGDMSMKMLKFFTELIKIFPKLIDIFLYIVNPTKLLKDIIYGLILGIKMMFEAIIDTLLGDLKNYFSGSPESGSEGSKKKCISPSISKILLLVLCPPLSILLTLGLKGLFSVIVCSLLTYFYYFPGLIYASLFIL